MGNRGKLRTVLTARLVSAACGIGISSSFTVSHAAVDARVLKDEWKRLESLGLSSPLRKTLAVQRGLLASLEEFTAGIENKESKGTLGISGASEEEASAGTSGGKGVGGEDFLDPWRAGSLGGWPFVRSDRALAQASAAWAVAGDAAAYGRLEGPGTAVLPLRVDVVPIGFSREEGHQGLDLTLDDLAPW